MKLRKFGPNIVEQSQRRQASHWSLRLRDELCRPGSLIQQAGNQTAERAQALRLMAEAVRAQAAKPHHRSEGQSRRGGQAQRSVCYDRVLARRNSSKN